MGADAGRCDQRRGQQPPRQVHCPSREHNFHYECEAPVIAEAAFLIGRQLGPHAEARFFGSVADGEVLIELLTIDDWHRTAYLVDADAGMPLGGTDASVVAMAERLGETSIATLDRRHFGVVRPNYGDAFELPL